MSPWNPALPGAEGFRFFFFDDERSQNHPGKKVRLGFMGYITKNVKWDCPKIGDIQIHGHFRHGKMMMNQRMVHGTTSIFRAILLETTMDLPIVLVTSVQQVTFWSISNSGQLQRLDLALTDGWLFQECCHFALKQWIALRENLQESPIFNGKIHGFRFRFSLKSIQ